MADVLLTSDIDGLVLPALGPNACLLVDYIKMFNNQDTIFTQIHSLIFPHFSPFMLKFLQFLNGMHEFMLHFVCSVES